MANKRVEPFLRLGGGLYTYVAALLLQFVLVILASIWFVVDGLLQVITGKEGLMPGGFLPTLVISVWEWLLSNQSWVFFGEGSFAWTPGGAA